MLVPHSLSLQKVPRTMEGATNPPWVCGIPKIPHQNEGQCLKLSFVTVRSAVSPPIPPPFLSFFSLWVQDRQEERDTGLHPVEGPFFHLCPSTPWKSGHRAGIHDVYVTSVLPCLA